MRLNPVSLSNPMLKAFTFSLLIGISAPISVSGAADKVPVVLVHGLYGSGSAMEVIKDYLVQNGGYNSNLFYNPDMTDNNVLCLADHLNTLNGWIDSALSEHPTCSRVDLIGHSRGGLNIMGYIWQYPDAVAKVRKVIGLAPAIGWCFGDTYDPRPADETPGDVQIWSFWGSDDPQIDGTVAFVDDGAVVREFSGQDHAGMRTSPLVHAEILSALQYDPVSSIQNVMNTETNLRFSLTTRSNGAVSYCLQRSGWIEIAVYSITGTQMKSLYQGFKNSGDHRVFWDLSDQHGKAVSNGLYLVRLRQNGAKVNRKLMVLR